MTACFQIPCLLLSHAVGGRVARRLLVAILALVPAPCLAAQAGTNWAGAKVTVTDLLKGETNHGKFAYFFASVQSRAGCHVAKVEGEKGKEVFVRRDGQRGKAYKDIAHPVFSPDGSALAYGVREGGGGFFVINEREGPRFDEALPDTFAFSGDGKRHAYLARKAGQLVVVVDGVTQARTVDDLDPWLQPPVFSADGSSVGYLEGSRPRKKMRAVINGNPGDLYDGVGIGSLRFSVDGRGAAYAAYDRSRGDHWFCVVDGARGNAFDILGVSFEFSPDGKRSAYTGRRGLQSFLVVDGEPEVPIEGIVDHSVTFSPDSRRLAYAAARQDRRSFVVIDGKAGPVYDGVGHSVPTGVSLERASAQAGYHLGSAAVILFSPDSRRTAYLTRSGLTQRVYVDGKLDSVEIDFLVGGMMFSPDSKRLMYGGRQGNRFFLVVDGQKTAAYDGLGYFGFSQDGRHTAFAAKKGDNFVIGVDGWERAQYKAVAAGPVFRSDGVLEILAADEKSLYRVEVKDF